MSSSDRDPPDPPPSVALTGAFRQADVPSSADAALAGDAQATGAFRIEDVHASGAAPSQPAPAGPPSMGLLHTGAFPAAAAPASEAPTNPLLAGHVSTPAAFEATAYVPPPERAEAAPPAARAETVAPARAATISLPPAADRARADTVDVPPRTAAAPRAHRPLEPMTPPPPAEDDPAVLSTRPPSAPVPPVSSGGGGWASLLVAVVCLAGVVYLVRHAFPELFRRTTVTVQADEGRPGTLQVRVQPAPAEVAWRLTEGGVERARGVATPDAQGTFELRPSLDELGEGVRAVTVELTRRDGAPIARHPVSLAVDRTAPLLRLEAPAAGAQVGADSPVRLLVTDTSRVQVACYVDERLVWKQSVEPLAGAAARVERPLTGLPPGEHTLSIDAVDAALQQTKLSRRIVVVDGSGAPPPPPPDPRPDPEPQPRPDSTSPTQRPGPAPPPPVVRLSWPDQALLGQGSVAVAVEDATEVEVLLDGEPHGLPIVLAPPAVKDGPHVLELVARNAGGETRELRTFTFDATPPTLSIRAPARAPSPVVVEGGVTDAIDRAPRLTLSVDGGPPRAVRLPERLELAPGSHQLVYVATDAAGNRVQRSVQVEVTATAPPPAKDPPPPVDAEGPRVTFVSPAGPAPLVTRERAVDVRVSDPAGLGQVRLLVDGRQRRPEQLTDERVDGAPGRRLRAALADLPDGPHEVVVEALDGLGNRTRAARAWVVDTTPPTLTLEGPAPTSITSPLDLAVRVRDASSVADVVMATAGQGPVSMAGTDVRRGQLVLPAGEHEVTVRARDAVGNEGTLTLRVQVRVGSPTQTAPPDEGIDVQVPARSGPKVTIRGVLPGGATATVDVTGVRHLSGATLPVEITLSEGRHLVVVTVVRPTGQRTVVQRAVVVDATGPSLERVRVTALDARTARVTGEVTDVGPVTVEVRVGDDVVARALPCEAPLRPGRNEVVVVARDDVGNERRLAQTIDVAAPTPTPTPPTTTDLPAPAPAVDPLDVVDSGDAREAQALAAFKAGRLDEALAQVEQVIAAVREGIRSPYVLRARVRIAQAAGLDPLRQRALLDQAFHDITRAMVNYRRDVRSHHYRLRGDVLTALGRRRQAEEDYERAEELQRREERGARKRR